MRKFIYNLLFKKHDEAVEDYWLNRIGEEVEIQQSKDKEVMNRRVVQLTNELALARKEEIASWFVEPYYVFSVSKSGSILLNGEQITLQELKNFKSEVRALKDMQVWRIVQNTIRQKAIEKAVLTSTDLYSLKGNEQILAGKMMIWNLDVIKTIIDDIDKAKLVAK